MSYSQTKRLIVDKIDSYPQIKEAALWIKKNQNVAFPTETVYGLGANALSEEAVHRIFIAKGRPSDNPLIVHIADQKQLQELVASIPEKAATLMKHFWPGPLTIVFPKSEEVPVAVTGGLSTVAIRMPDHPIALELIKAAELPIAAPSANRSGKPSPTTADHVYQDLNGRIAAIVDGGPTGIGVESTVIDCSSDIPVILRPGGVTKEQIEEVIGFVDVDKALIQEGQAPKSPGMKYKHYAPDAPLILVEGERDFLQNLIDKEKENGKKVGVLTTEENKAYYKADVILSCGKRENLDSILRELYQTLRAFNDCDLDLILSESFPRHGVGEALMNRLFKAANGQVVKQS